MAYDEIVHLSPNNIVTPHWTRVQAADDRYHYVLTGIMVPHLKGNGSDWRRLTLKASIVIPSIPDGKDFRARHWAPSVSLAAIGNDNVANNAGYAVDAYWLDTPWHPRRHVLLNVHSAVRDNDGHLFRMAYEISLTGTYE